LELKEACRKTTAMEQTVACLGPIS
jgi:hypothetical protein